MSAGESRRKMDRVRRSTCPVESNRYSDAKKVRLTDDDDA
jgi:hypothetical protein